MNQAVGGSRDLGGILVLVVALVMCWEGRAYWLVYYGCQGNARGGGKGMNKADGLQVHLCGSSVNFSTVYNMLFTIYSTCVSVETAWSEDLQHTTGLI